MAQGRLGLGRWLIAGWLLALPALASRAAEPSLQQADGRWLLGSLPAILEEPQVMRHLETGLTTGFDFRAELPGGKVLPCAHVEIRFEPWDEVYFLRVVDRGGIQAMRTLKDKAELAAAWSGLRLDFGRDLDDPLRLVLDVLPFSQREHQDTRRWFSESLARAGRGTAEGAAAASESRTEALGQALHVLMATSIERRSVSTFRWTLPLSAAPRNAPR